jgi:2-polyprenyl-6-methoxyphenol hydroxylase-like FAD-dependent oxidoreductase
VLGDAVVAVNPTVGQGMTMTAQQAVALRSTIRTSGSDGIEARAARALADAVRTAWEIGTVDDLMATDPQSAGAADRLIDAYLGRAIAVGTEDRHVASALMRVLHLLAPSTSMLHPRIMWAVLGAGSQRHVRAAEIERRQRHAGVITSPAPA